MRLGYLTEFKPEALRTAKEIGFSIVEAQAWSWSEALEKGKAEIKRAAAAAKSLLAEYDIAISALTLYRNHLEDGPATAKKNFAGVMELANCLGVKVIASMAGRERDKSVADSIPAFKRVFAPIAKMAETAGLQIAFENWPGGMNRYPHWGSNLAHSPQAWEMMFDAVPSPALGLEFDPSHLYWQQIDHIGALQQFADRVYHVHAKDTEIVADRLAEGGIFGDGWWRYRTPGLGEINWSEFISTLYEIGYDGDIVIEHEDRILSGPRFALGLQLGYNHLAPLLGC